MPLRGGASNLVVDDAGDLDGVAESRARGRGRPRHNDGGPLVVSRRNFSATLDAVSANESQGMLTKLRAEAASSSKESLVIKIGWLDDRLCVNINAKKTPQTFGSWMVKNVDASPSLEWKAEEGRPRATWEVQKAWPLPTTVAAETPSVAESSGHVPDHAMDGWLCGALEQACAEWPESPEGGAGGGGEESGASAEMELAGEEIEQELADGGLQELQEEERIGSQQREPEPEPPVVQPEVQEERPLSPAFMSSFYLNKPFQKPEDDPPPLRPTPSVKQHVRVVEAKPLPAGMPILVIYNRFINLILRGIKTVEMRGKPAWGVRGQRFALCVSGAGSREDGWHVLGTALFSEAQHKTGLAKDAWSSWVQEHSCVGALAWPAKYPWVYLLKDVEAFDKPVFYLNPEGSRGERVDWRSFGRSWVAAEEEPEEPEEEVQMMGQQPEPATMDAVMGGAGGAPQCGGDEDDEDECNSDDGGDEDDEDECNSEDLGDYPRLVTPDQHAARQQPPAKVKRRVTRHSGAVAAPGLPLAGGEPIHHHTRAHPTDFTVEVPPPPRRRRRSKPPRPETVPEQQRLPIGGGLTAVWAAAPRSYLQPSIQRLDAASAKGQAAATAAKKVLAGGFGNALGPLGLTVVVALTDPMSKAQYGPCDALRTRPIGSEAFYELSEFYEGRLNWMVRILAPLSTPGPSRDPAVPTRDEAMRARAVWHGRGHGCGAGR